MVPVVKRSRLQGCLQLVVRGFLGLIGLIVVLAVIGFVYERYGSAQDATRYPPLGQLIAVENHKMHLYCTGTGSPTVVLESPANGSAIDWGLVQPEIAKFTRVCSYDRAGFAWSEPGPLPRSAGQAARELEALLRTAGERGPFVLVGASYGGHVVRLFANDHPDQVAGIVLADTRPEKLFTIPIMREQADSGLGAVSAIATLCDFGLMRLMAALVPDKMMPPAAFPVYQAHPGSISIVFQAKLMHTSSDEAHAMDASDAQIAAVHSLGQTPLIVIRHGKPMFGSFPPDQAAALETQWRTFQEEIAAQSTQSQIVVAENSGHLMQAEQPSIIVDAVRQLWSKTSQLR